MLTWNLVVYCCLLVVVFPHSTSAHNHTTTICGANEVYLKCGSDCKQSCNTLNRDVCLAVCREGCFCIAGYAKNADGRCVPVEECPEESCPDNQFPFSCVSSCNDCIQRGRCYLKRCIAGCECKKGYYRDRNGTCIPVEFCPAAAPCGEDEVFQECGSDCRQSCKTLNQKMCLAVCRKGCFCVPGYVRNEDGRCIPAHECPKEYCPDYQRPSSCIVPCNDCLMRGRCRINKCNPGCDCEVGYYRGRNGTCIPAFSCPPAFCPNNEVLSPCISPCNDCVKRGRCPFNGCKPGCDCRIGYHRHPNGTCIPAKLCPTETQCGENEVRLECGSDCQQTCRTLKQEICFRGCRAGCFCLPGYVRNEAGKCIPANECPQRGQCGRNEVYLTCGNDCGQFCKSLDQEVCIDECREGCFCLPGYARNDNGECIPVNKCLGAPCGENAVYMTCGSDCRQTCKTLDQKVCPAVCRQGCFCLPGYVRNNDGKCIPANKCPKESCPDNQVPSGCVSSCNDCKRRRKCRFMGCNAGCDCREGYYRHQNGTCILEKYCPPVRCPRNETISNCVTPCTSCTYVRNGCPIRVICEEGCDCLKGFARNTKGQCVRIDDCDVLGFGYDER